MFPMIDFNAIHQVVTGTPAARLGEVKADHNGGLYRYVMYHDTVTRGHIVIPDTGAGTDDDDFDNGVDGVDGQYWAHIAKLATPAALGTAEGEFDDWYIVIDASTTNTGLCFKIKKHYYAQGKLELYIPQGETMPTLGTDSDDDFTIFSPDVVMRAAATALFQTVRGVCMADATTGQYGWIQFSGFCKGVMGGAAVAINTNFTPGGTAGEVLIAAADETIDNVIVVGHYLPIAGANAQVSPAFINLA